MVVAGDEAKSRYVPFRARMRGNEWKVLVNVPVTFNLDEAAAALAIIVPQRSSSRFGKRTIHTALQDAALRGLTKRELEQADPDLVDLYRTELLRHGVFPAEAATPHLHQDG